MCLSLPLFSPIKVGWLRLILLTAICSEKTRMEVAEVK